MTNAEIKKNAETIFNYIKDTIAKARKTNKEKNLTGWARKDTYVEVRYYEEGEYNRSKNAYDYTFRISVWGNEVVTGIESKYDVKAIADALEELLNKQKKVRGWTALTLAKTEITLDSGLGGSWYSRPYTINAVTLVTLPDPQCSEFKSLRNYIAKYGNLTIGDYELFVVRMGGKRGSLWDEEGPRHYLDNRPKRCAEILAELRKYRGAKDKMSVKRGEEKYIDPEEYRHSVYYEVECTGEFYTFAEVTITSPNGKVKYTRKVY